MKSWFWIGLMSVLLGACLDDPECLDMNNAHIGISFKKMFDGKVDTVAFIGIKSPDSDSIFYSFTRATGVELLLNPYMTQVQYTLEGVYNQNFLVMDYETRLVKFISEDCGARYMLSNLEFTDHDFDSLKIITNVLSSTLRTNLEVYRCPRTNLAKVTFRKLVNTQERPDTVYLNSITADYPAIFYIPKDTLSTINLPLNGNATATTFNFNFKDGSSKSITFNYNRTAWNDFDAYCGTLTLFDGLSVVANDFNNVQITRDSIQDPPITNVKIFK
jgi:hypothetical protein